MSPTNRFVIVAVLLLVLGTPMFAQTVSGRVTGTVADPYKALIPGATVMLINTETKEPSTTISNSTGEYDDFPILPRGTYNLRVELPGFVPSVYEGMQVGGTTIRVSSMLTVFTRNSTTPQFAVLDQ